MIGIYTKSDSSVMETEVLFPVSSLCFSPCTLLNCSLPCFDQSTTYILLFTVQVFEMM